MEWIASLFAVIAGLYSVGKLVISWHKKRKKLQLQKKIKEGKEGDINIVAERLCFLFKSHGVEKTQIPRFLSDKFQLNLSDLHSNESIINAFKEPILADICERFGIDREWLDGLDTPIYPDRFFDKDPNRFIDFLYELKEQFDSVEMFTIKCKKDKLKKDDSGFEIALLFRVKIADYGFCREAGIYKYFPLSDIYYWGYERTRLQLKAFVLIAWQLGVHIYGCELPEEKIEQIRERKIFPDLFIEKCHFAAWCPDEYIFTEDESCAVKDSQEALLAREYMGHSQWMEKLISLTGLIKVPLKR